MVEVNESEMNLNNVMCSIDSSTRLPRHCEFIKDKADGIIYDYYCRDSRVCKCSLGYTLNNQSYCKYKTK